jgi:hypothetical protein
MRLLPIIMVLAAAALAVPLVTQLEDLDTAISNRLAVATEKTEVKALGQAGALVDAYLAATINDKKTRALLPKAAKAITKSRTPDSSIAADGQVAIQEELGAIAAAIRLDASTKWSLVVIEDDELEAKMDAKMGALLDKGDAMMASLATVMDFAKADALANKAIAVYEKAVALADELLAL